MLPEVIPIVTPDIDWNTYLYTCKRILGRSISEELDSKRIAPDSVQAFITTLGTLKKDVLAQNLKHSFFSFLVAGTYEMFHDLMQEANIQVSVTDSQVKYVQLAIISASVENYLHFVEAYCKTLECSDLRLLAAKIAAYFDKLGIQQFLKYRHFMLES